MFNAAAAAASRRPGCALTRSPRTTSTVLSRFLLSSSRARQIHNVAGDGNHYFLQNRPVPALSSPLLTLHRASRAIAPHLQIRSLSFAHRMKLGLREASKGIWRKNPILLPLAIISVVGATIIFAYIAYVEVTQVGPQYHKFPPPVAESLRTAVYYTDVDLNPPRALKAYKEALRIAIEMGMHPFSDEVLGIKLQVAMMLEKAGLVKPAVEVLERTKAETLAWVEAGRKKQMVEKRKQEERKRNGDEMPAQQKLEINNPEVLDTYQKMNEIEEYEERQREKAMKKAVGMGIKLAELYASDYIQDSEKAEKTLIGAVELAIKEIQLRESLGLPVGSGGSDQDGTTWLNRTELAAALVDLAGNFTDKDKLEFALPLYLQAVSIIATEDGRTPSCKQVQLLSAVAATMGELGQRPMRVEDPEAKRKETLEAATKWALKCLDVSTKVPVDAWDEMCDEPCVAAMYNLGEFAEALGDLKEAKDRYKQALAFAKKHQFEEGILVATEALNRVTKH